MNQSHLHQLKGLSFQRPESISSAPAQGSAISPRQASGDSLGIHSALAKMSRLKKKGGAQSVHSPESFSSAPLQESLVSKVHTFAPASTLSSVNTAPHDHSKNV